MRNPHFLRTKRPFSERPGSMVVMKLSRVFDKSVGRTGCASCAGSTAARPQAAEPQGRGGEGPSRLPRAIPRVRSILCLEGVPVPRRLSLLGRRENNANLARIFFPDRAGCLRMAPILHD